MSKHSRFEWSLIVKSLEENWVDLTRPWFEWRDREHTCGPLLQTVDPDALWEECVGAVQLVVKSVPLTLIAFPTNQVICKGKYRSIRCDKYVDSISKFYMNPEMLKRDLDGIDFSFPLFRTGMNIPKTFTGPAPDKMNLLSAQISHEPRDVEKGSRWYWFFFYSLQNRNEHY